ncbi:MarR family winged helix-turn-helix transcriptional regulator [Glycomyces tenuis]|uniref:MarR family winged helix-turn-helix transcriptional regulator n=1 Tax=Glycomyces tenuis TaxID=58116 RepID=UPI00047AE6EE|nr:MarR family transcriptional regulator [Glycomyces tenuis]
MSDDALWLDDAEMETWLALISLVMKLPSALDEQLRRDAKLSHFEYGVLAVLERAEDHTRRMSDLAYLCNGSLSRLSHVARRLEEAGLIERFACPTDGRATLAKLTDHGLDILAKAAPGHVALVRHLVFDVLDEDETARFGVLAKRILTRIEEG